METMSKQLAFTKKEQIVNDVDDADVSIWVSSAGEKVAWATLE